MKLFLYLFVAAVVVIVGLFIVSLFLPDTYNIEEKKFIKASPEQVYNYVRDLSHWRRWSGWDALHDSSAVYKVAGPQTGEGTIMTWEGENIGKGRIVITKDNPSKSIKYDMLLNEEEFLAKGYIFIKDTTGGSIITWGDRGELSGPLSRLMFIVVKNELANNFSTGLDSLKYILENKDYHEPPANN